VVEILEDPGRARAMVERARQEVVAHWDSAIITARLAEEYREGLRRKRAVAPAALTFSADRA